MLSSQSTDEL
uniref:Uncharacterized protein n=1 Tax=Anguilla anguilla TaxID=7936 RepID=A0A0E9U160_ANGAN